MSNDDTETRTWQDFFDDVQDTVLPKGRESEQVPEEAVDFFDEILDEDRDLDRANQLLEEWFENDDENDDEN